LGVVFEREDGSLVLKFLDTWINLYEPEMQAEGYQAAKQAVQESPGPVDDMEDSIPW
jgi:hypothetical protein